MRIHETGLRGKAREGEREKDKWERRRERERFIEIASYRENESFGKV